MAKRFTDTEIWDKEWFMALSPKYKCLIRFLFDKCDIAGVWSANWILASSYIGESVSEKDLSILEDRVVKIGAAKFFVIEFIEFQYGTLSENCKPHQKIISLLKKNQIEFNEIKGYLYPIHRVKDKDKEKEEEKDKENNGPDFQNLDSSGYEPNSISIAPEEELDTITPEEEEGFEKDEKIIDPYSFDAFWDLYDKKVGKPEASARYKLLSQKDKEDIFEYIPRYKRAKPDKTFRKDPERFIKKRTWNDEIVEENKIIELNGTNNNHTRRSTSSAISADQKREGRNAFAGVAKSVLLTPKDQFGT